MHPKDSPDTRLRKSMDPNMEPTIDQEDRDRGEGRDRTPRTGGVSRAFTGPRGQPPGGRVQGALLPHAHPRPRWRRDTPHAEPTPTMERVEHHVSPGPERDLARVCQPHNHHEGTPP